jgi:hypothetical protein
MMLRLSVFCRLFFFLMFVILLSQHSVAQEMITVSGKVVDVNNGKPIAFASVGIIGEARGTMTNEDGEFEFRMSVSSVNDTFCVSYLGYAPFKAVVRYVRNKKNMYIPLQPMAYMMKMVEITARRPSDAYDIVKRAVDSLKRNMPPYPWLCDAFYREYISENNRYARALEAAITIYDEALPSLGDQFYPIKINGLRRSENYLSDFTRAENYNQLSLFLTQNLDVKWYLTGLNDMLFNIDSLIIFNQTPVYIISAVPEKTQKKTYVTYSHKPSKDGKRMIKEKIKTEVIVERGTDRFYRRTYYVNANTYAFIKLTSTDTLYRPFILNQTRTNGLFTSLNSTSRQIEFFNFQGRMYPRYAREAKEIGYYKNKDSALFISVLKYSDLIINDVQTENVKEIPVRQQPRLFVDIAEQGYTYVPDFWANYNYLPEDARQKEVTADLAFIRSEQSADTSQGDISAVLMPSDSPGTSAAVSDTASVKDVPQSVEDLVFRVQILVSGQKYQAGNPVFKGLKDVYVYYHNGSYKYTWGAEPNMEAAIQVQQYVRSLGFSDAFIVPFYNNKRITVDEALRLMLAH